MNLFDKATSAPKTSAAKKDKLNIKIADKDFNDNLVAFVKAKKELDVVKARLATAQSAVKDASLDVWVKEYSSTKRNPGSVIVSSDDASFQFVPTDKYLSVDGDRANELKGKYGDEIVHVDTVFSFNPALLSKYANVLSELIEKSKEIDDADKANLIVRSDSISVAKGTIDRATEFDTDVADFIGEVNPIFQMKYPKLNS